MVATVGRQIGVDVPAAEGIDGLPGIADEHHRRVAVEGPLEDLPLNRVGVLELIDQDDVPSCAHACAGRRAGGVEGRSQISEEIVIAEHAQPALAGIELRPDGPSEGDTYAG